MAHPHPTQTPIAPTPDSSSGKVSSTIEPLHKECKTRESDLEIPKPPPKRIELKCADCPEKTGFAFPRWKKWSIISIIFVIQCSMNLNASLYANAVPGLTKEYNISAQAARVGQCIFLVAYGFGCELWAPWSEEFGRRPIMQLSLFFVNVSQIPVALSKNYATVLVGRFFGGLSSAGGSVTLGMVADMWNTDDQQYAVNFIVLASVGGSVIGPIIGGFIEEHLNWRWCFWVQLIFGVVTQAIHLVLVPETRTTILLDNEAKDRRKKGDKRIYGPNEMKEHRITMREVLTIWYRPFVMFVTEPIVLCLSLLSGFSDALIFLFLEAFGPVFQQWDFGAIDTGLAFIPLLIGYFIAYFSFFPTIRSQRIKRAKQPNSIQPEARLWWLLWTVPCLPIGLLGFACTSLGPSFGIPWIAPMIFAAIIGIANFAVYMATVDYMIAAYGPYSASATGGNGMARDFLAGVSAMYGNPFYEVVPGRFKLFWPSTILAIIGIFIAAPVYVFYWMGPTIRAKSKFAMTLAKDGLGDGGTGLDVELELQNMNASTATVNIEQAYQGADHDDDATAPAPTGTDPEAVRRVHVMNDRNLSPAPRDYGRMRGAAWSTTAVAGDEHA